MLKRKKLSFILSACIFSGWGAAQAQTPTFSETIDWQITTKSLNSVHGELYFLNFPGAEFEKRSPGLPLYRREIVLTQTQELRAWLENSQYRQLADPKLLRTTGMLPPEVKPRVRYEDRHGLRIAIVEFSPVRVSALGQPEGLVSFELHTAEVKPDISIQAQSGGARSKRSASQSALANGTWYKLGITQTGVYKLDYNFLKNAGLGLQGGDLARLQLYGKPGGVLPERNNLKRDDDLIQNAIEVVDANGNFDGDDYVLFYARGPVTWAFDSMRRAFRHEPNHYCDTAYYFLTVGTDNGKRVGTSPLPATLAGAGRDVTSYDDFEVYEKDIWSDINKNVKSGREWYGDEFRSLTSNSISKNFSFRFPNVDPAAKAQIYINAAGRTGEGGMYLQAEANGTQVGKMTSIPVTEISNQEGPYVMNVEISDSLRLTSPDLNLKLSFTKRVLDDAGWLNYIRVTTRNKLQNLPGQFAFRNKDGFKSGMINRFRMGGGEDRLRIWDVTNFHDVRLQQYSLDNGTLNFDGQTDVLHEYVCFDGSSFLSPVSGGRISNQNLHGLEQADMLIVSHPDFIKAANRLADFHRAHDGFVVHVVTPGHIYNEFSSGAQDPTAIRDFVKMFYQRHKQNNALKAPRFLLLMGDASYDYKNRIPNNTNLVPTYHNLNSYYPLGSFCADDYYGCMEENGGEWKYSSDNDKVMVGVGRFPVNTLAQAEAMVDKVLNYHKPEAQGDWRQKLVLVADDEDGDTFLAN